MRPLFFLPHHASVRPRRAGIFLGRLFLKPEGRDLAARKLFLASIAYLPLVLAALVADRLLYP